MRELWVATSSVSMSIYSFYIPHTGNSVVSSY